jgi:histidine triad (HIT) family protein
MTVFEQIFAGTLPGRVIKRGERVSAILDIRPISRGDILVIPHSPFADIHAIPPNILCEMILLSQEMSALAVERLQAQGVNLLMNNGAAADQEISHAHIHVIPRYEGDGLVPWYGKDTSPEELDTVLDLLTA